MPYSETPKDKKSALDLPTAKTKKKPYALFDRRNLQSATNQEGSVPTTHLTEEVNRMMHVPSIMKMSPSLSAMYVYNH